MTGNTCGLHLVQGIIGRFVPAYPLEKVEHQLGFLHIGTKGVTMETRTLGGSKLYPYIGLLQLNGIIARTHILVGMMEQHLFLISIRYWQEGYIAQLANTRTTEMLMSETYQYRVGLMITGTPVPATSMLGWSQLHITKGNIGSQKHMAMTACSNTWVHVLGKVVGSLTKSGLWMGSYHHTSQHYYYRK